MWVEVSACHKFQNFMWSGTNNHPFAVPVAVIPPFSHNYRMDTEVRRDLWRSSLPASLLKEGQQSLPEQTAKDCVREALEYLQGWRLNNLCGQLVLMLSHLHSKEVLPDIQAEPPVFQLVPFASWSVIG